MPPKEITIFSICKALFLAQVINSNKISRNQFYGVLKNYVEKKMSELVTSLCYLIKKNNPLSGDSG